MSVSADLVHVRQPRQLSKRARGLCWACFAATFFGASAIAISFSLVLSANAGSPLYWTVAALLLMLWFASLTNIYRLTVAVILAEG